jgi:V8-like Glu-specific endopeptidase
LLEKNIMVLNVSFSLLLLLAFYVVQQMHKKQEVDLGIEFKTDAMQPRIISGTVTPTDAYENFVQVADADGWVYCGGVLVAPDIIVVTAGHC